MADFSHEDALARHLDLTSADFFHIAGVDEAGRGPWAGPVFAAAVSIPDRTLAWLPQLRDSKKLSAQEREKLAAHIKKDTIWAVAAASAREIDRVNILEATKRAMRRALARLACLPRGIIVDGIHSPAYQPPQAQSIVTVPLKGGDDLSCSIAAASILAKTQRDYLMTLLARRYPFYGWERNMGYGVKAHREGLAQKGVSPHHRFSFKPVSALAKETTSSPEERKRLTFADF